MRADGRLIAYNSDESGRWEVYIATFPGFTEKRQVSLAGGMQPRWRRDGKELFYLAADGTMMAAEVSVNAPPMSGMPGRSFRRASARRRTCRSTTSPPTAPGSS